MARPPSSVTRTGAYEPFELQVARGQIPWHTATNIFGYQVAVGTGTPILVWENTAAYVYPTVAQQMNLHSTSASDINVNVTIVGLDANYNQITERLTLTNGTTGVLTTNSFLRVTAIFANDANYALPVGDILLSNAVKTVIYAKIIAGVNKSQMSQYTVPAGYTFYLTRVDVFANEAGSGNNFGNYQVYTKNNVTGQTFTLLQSPFLGRYEARRIFPFPYTEKTDIQWQVSVGTATSPVGVIVEGVLIKDDAGTA